MREVRKELSANSLQLFQLGDIKEHTDSQIFSERSHIKLKTPVISISHFNFNLCRSLACEHTAKCGVNRRISSDVSQTVLAV